jgi:hypothetical protein
MGEVKEGLAAIQLNLIVRQACGDEVADVF